MIILECFVNKFMDNYVDLLKGQALAEAREVMTVLVSNELMIIDYNFGKSHQVIESLESTIKMGLFARMININMLRQSKWMASAFGIIKHNHSIVHESPMLMRCIERILGMTGGFVANFFAQYYQPSITGKFSRLYGHLAYHQDKFFTHYCLLTTLGDEQKCPS